MSARPSLLRRTMDRLRGRPVEATPRQVLHIDYRPSRNGRADPGEVVWTWVPYEDQPRNGKDRPVLVIGTIGRGLAVLPLTSKDHTHRNDCVELGRGSWDRQGRVSYVKLDRLLRVAPTKVRREGGMVDERRFELIVAELRDYHAGRAR